MLTLRDTSGNDLTDSPPVAVKLAATSALGAYYAVSVLLVEDSGTLPTAQVSGTVDWDDGSPVETFPYTETVSGTLAIQATRRISNGNHVISVYGSNFRAPVPDKVRVNFDVTVEQPSQPAPANALIYGPILPRDDGYPNAKQWSFNTGVDNGVLESSIRMLLSTVRGERVMQPDYGTNLRQLVFEHQQPGMESQIQEEIVRAVTRWEPRVKFVALNINKTGPTTVEVRATFQSNLTSAVLTTFLVFSQ